MGLGRVFLTALGRSCNLFGGERIVHQISKSAPELSKQNSCARQNYAFLAPEQIQPLVIQRDTYVPNRWYSLCLEYQRFGTYVSRGIRSEIQPPGGESGFDNPAPNVPQSSTIKKQIKTKNKNTYLKIYGFQTKKEFSNIFHSRHYFKKENLRNTWMKSTSKEKTSKSRKKSQISLAAWLKWKTRLFMLLFSHFKFQRTSSRNDPFWGIAPFRYFYFSVQWAQLLSCANVLYPERTSSRWEVFLVTKS